jgi:hypothetical protein
MTLQDFNAKYRLFFESITNKTAINPITAMELSYRLSKNGSDYFTKNNNFYAIADINSRKYKKYLTPFEGIEAGVNKIVNSPMWTQYKLGTLKANPALQTKRILELLFADYGVTI